MAGGYSDGAVIIDTGLNNTGFFKDAKQFKAAVQSLKGTVNRVGREMGQSGGAYLKSIQRNARASREFKQELAVLEAQAKKLRDALTNPAAAVDKQIRALEADLEQTKKTMDSMTGPGARMDLDAWDKAKNDVKNLTAQLETLQKRREELSSPEYFQSAEYQQMANAYNAVAEKVQAMRAQVDAAGGSFGNFMRYAGRGAAALMKMAVPGVLRFLRRLAAGAKNAFIQLAKLSGRAVSKGLKTIGSLATRAGKALFGLGRNAKQAGGGFNLSLRNILKYGLGIRSLFVLFNRLRNAIKEGFSALMDNDARVRASVGALSGALNGLKGSMAAAFAPILTAIAPALTTLINLLATATNYVGMFLAALTGQSYYMAASGISAVGSAASGASGSVKELKRQLAGFDELNILSAGNNGGGGGGGAGAGASVANYTQIPIDSGIAAFVERLRGLFEAGEYNKIGGIIADGINGAFERVQALIKWDSIGGVVTKYVDALAGIFNGIVGRIDWPNIGRTFAEGINTISYALNHAFDVVDLAGLGKGIGDALTGLVARVDFGSVGTTLANLLTAKLVVVGNALARFDWAQFGPKLAEGVNKLIKRIDEAVGGIDWPGIARKMVSGLNGFIRHIEWRELGDTLARRLKSMLDAAKEAITTFSWSGAAAGFAKALNAFFRRKDLWTAAGDTIKAALHGILDFAESFVVNFDEISAANAIRAALGRIDWGNIASGFWNTAKNAFKKAGNFVKVLLGGDVYDVAGDAVDQMWERGSGNASSKSYSVSWVSTLATSIGKALASIPWKKLFDEVKKAAGETISGLVDGLFGTKDGLFLVKLMGALAALQLLLPGKFNAFGKILIGAIQIMGGAVKLALEAMITTTTGQITTLIGLFGALGVAAGNLVYNKFLKDFSINFAEETAPKVAEVVENLTPTKGKRYATTGNTLADLTLMARGELPFVDESIYDKSNDRRAIEENTKAVEENTQGTKLTDEQYVKWGMTLIDMGYNVAQVTEALKLNESQTTALQKAVLEHRAATEDNTEAVYDATKDPFSSTYSGPTSAAVDWTFSTETAFGKDFREALQAGGSTSVSVDVFPDVPGGQKYKNNGLLKWLETVFAPGAETEARVELIRQGWKTVQSYVQGFMGGTIGQFVELVKKGWTLIDKWANQSKGGPLSQLVELAKKGWTLIDKWANQSKGGPLSQFVELAKKGWTLIDAWANQSKGGPLSQLVELAKKGWTLIDAWANQSKGGPLSQLVELAKKGWTLIDAWANQSKGGPLSQFVELAKKGWTLIDAWANQSKGGPLSQFVELAKKGWTLIDAWANQSKGSPLSQFVELAKKGWEWVDSWAKRWAESPIAQLVALAKWGWDWVDSWSKQWAQSPIAQFVRLDKWDWTWVDTWAQKFAQTPITQYVNLAVGKVATGLKNALALLGITFASGGVITAGGSVARFASGGVIRGGAAKWWNGIPKYAAGTSRAHGTMFVAGEAGPEIVGHINGRTEILNKSQLAQTMYSAVTSGMLAALKGIEFKVPAMATGSVMPYEVSAQIAKSAADIQGTLDANNEDLIQTIISVIGQQTAAIVAALQAQQRQGAGGLNAQQVINEINRRTLMGLQPLRGV